MEEWKEYKLGEISDIQTGPFGSQLHQKDYVPLGTPCIMPTNIGNRLNIDTTNIAHVKGEDVTRLQRHCVKEGDIIYSRRGDIEKCAYILPVNEGWLCGTGCLRIRVKDNDVNSRFLAYQLSTCECKKWIVGNAVGSTMLNLNTSILKELPLRLPSKNKQDRLVNILKSLDDKIEVNRRINDNFYFAFFEVMLIWALTTLRNDNLEQQAQALFKSWFVDFEPFRDQPFVESELGMIPEGWRVGRYEEIIETTISGDWGKEKPEGNYIHKVACIRGCDFQDIKNGLRGNTPERYILEKNYQSKHFHHNDVLVEISGGTQTVSTGRVCLVSQLLIDKFNADIVCTNFCRVIRPIAAYAAYLYYSWLYKYNGKVMFGYENGTSGIKNFRIKDFISVEPVVIPPANLLGKFQQFVDNVQIQIQTKGSESSRLAELRDTLLPRLMSGEIKVEDVTL